MPKKQKKPKPWSDLIRENAANLDELDQLTALAVLYHRPNKSFTTNQIVSYCDVVRLVIEALGMEDRPISESAPVANSVLEGPPPHEQRADGEERAKVLALERAHRPAACLIHETDRSHARREIEAEVLKPTTTRSTP